MISPMCVGCQLHQKKQKTERTMTAELCCGRMKQPCIQSQPVPNAARPAHTYVLIATGHATQQLLRRPACSMLSVQPLQMAKPAIMHHTHPPHARATSRIVSGMTQPLGDRASSSTTLPAKVMLLGHAKVFGGSSHETAPPEPVFCNTTSWVVTLMDALRSLWPRTVRYIHPHSWPTTHAC